MPTQEQDKTNAGIKALGSVRSQLGRVVNKDFPALKSVLPTKLGNVIRCFESYPERQYSMSAIPLYPRLIATVDKEYMEQIDNAKNVFDFMINCSVLSAVLALSILVAGLIYPIPLSQPRPGILWLIKIAFFFFLSWSFYVSSIGRASEWGDLVKGAFDLYRWKLLEQLGFKRVPENMQKERALWSAISAQMIFGDRPNARLLEYVRPTPFARGIPQTAKLETARGLSKTDKTNILTVTVLVKNTGAEERTVESVKLTDTMPERGEYLWDSAKIARSSASTEKATDDEEIAVWHPLAEVTGANPYQFLLGDLEYGDRVLLKYQVLISD